LKLHASLHYDDFYVALVWLAPNKNRPVISACARVRDENCLEWTLRRGRKEQTAVSYTNESAIRSRLKELAEIHPVTGRNFEAVAITWSYSQYGPETRPCPPLPPEQSPWDWLAGQIRRMVRQFQQDGGFGFGGPWVSRSAERQEAELARLRQNQEVAAQQQLEREQRRVAREERKIAEEKAREAAARQPAPQGPLPPVPVRFEFPNIEVQETALPLSNLGRFNLVEKAALWWISNQTDSLLCLPYCRIERLEYQVRTALRVLGPLRGRALLSDEVGLGKTIEAGLVLKELLTRGMVKRFLILTVPSLVDQWEEELNEKFGLSVATTNRGASHAGEGRFWEENFAIVASLHTLKQPAQLDVARRFKWDILVVDEAHYLRNRNSQAWQAVAALPRQFLLLLTATPVQNSLEELYNLVTLLQPGQLPPPKEFRKRFIDPKLPRRPREPEELRRLLSQVMIRNTRANAGLKLPPRRAETVLFAAGAGEREFWERWEDDFRRRLLELNQNQASLWGRLLLQAAGSSPGAWRGALEKFPDQKAARSWRADSPLEESWSRKCQLLTPLAKGEGGVVVFSQFLATQAGIAEYLRSSGALVHVINGETPAADRQPITEEFRRSGGALLLTHSGTEGRNLQFCHQLVNFDLPWNPMEIEQRIGRLHRYGQRQPVRIYNFTQQGTLQQHLLEVLQEKLNLFELVIGETGLVLGERFDGDEFAEEVFRRWRDNEGKVAEAISGLGEQLKAARGTYQDVKELDQTLFANDYASDL
jgi:superfamily II DNA or RNA helicase